MPKRPFDLMRPTLIRPHFLVHPEGSALVAYGETQVICTASVDERVPPWLKNSGKGWITAEYDMLPRATQSRNGRDSHKGKIKGRTQEIGRLIGRALRAAVDLTRLGERTITIDCDVIQADGGTRTAAITGGWVALALAIAHLKEKKVLKSSPLTGQVAAVSAGILDTGAQLDLDYAMDSRARVDMNVVMTGKHNLVEVQGTGEHTSFDRNELNQMLDLAFLALPNLLELQRQAIGVPYNNEMGATQAVLNNASIPITPTGDKDL